MDQWTKRQIIQQKLIENITETYLKHSSAINIISNNILIQKFFFVRKRLQRRSNVYTPENQTVLSKSAVVEVNKPTQIF